MTNSIDKDTNKEDKASSNNEEYEKLVNEVRSKINVKATEYVPRMYEALIKDGYDPDQARERIERDFLNVWSKKWIKENLPKEAVHVQKARTIKHKFAEVTSNIADNKVLVSVDNEGKQEQEQPQQQQEPTEKPIIQETKMPNLDKPSSYEIELDLNNSALWRKLFNLKNVGTSKAYLKIEGNNVSDVLSPMEKRKQLS